MIQVVGDRGGCREYGRDVDCIDEVGVQVTFKDRQD